MVEVFSSVEFWKIAGPLFGAIIAWVVNEWRKKVWEQYHRKEESYKTLLECLNGFYVGNNNAIELKLEFINQLNRCWLYSPDEVILKGYIFLDTVSTDKTTTNEEKEKALGDFVASIRSDILSRKLVKETNLNGRDFKHLDVN